ncbi:MAG: 4Fe-4S binding protein [Clostridia bacterium]
MEKIIMPTTAEITAVKGDGFLLNRGTRKFSARIITSNGCITAKQMECVTKAASKFGNGNITFTVRLTMEIPGIDFDDIPAFKEFIAKEGLETGGTGAKVRPVVSCKGSTCVFGLYDTMGLAKEVHQKFYKGYRDVVLPHKFKIAVGGCPNNCAKPDLNDVGIVGQRVVSYDLDKCKGCGKCAVEINCPMKAATVVDKKVVIDKNICNNCGRCVGKCPFGVTANYNDMLKFYIGGRWGKQIRLGTSLNTLFTKDEILDVIEKSIHLFKDYGLPKERLADTVERLGMEKVEEILLK